MDDLEFQNKVLSELLIKNDTKDVGILMDFICQNNSFDTQQQSVVRERLLRHFIPAFERKWKNAFYITEKFNKMNAKWLSSNFIITFDRPKMGRKSVDFENSSKSTKRRKSLNLLDTYSHIEIENAFFSSLRSSGKKELLKKIKNLISASTKDTEEITNNEKPIAFSLEEAIALAEDAKLTKHQYESIRIQTKAHRADILPLYQDLEVAKKACLPPDGSIKVTESGVRINLQDICDLTVKRMLQIPNILPSNLTQKENVALNCLYKYGCDGASDQSRYNQKFSEPSKSDASVFIMTMVPMKIYTVCTVNCTVNCTSTQCKNSVTIWENENPGSTKLCRLLMYEQAPETKERTIAEINLLKEKIKNLVPTNIKVPDSQCIITVSHEFALTMVDGKVCQALSETPSAATCYICGAKPSQMNKLQELVNRSEKEENFQYGMSTLHAWIRLMECILHISYRLEFRKWLAKDDNDKEKMKAAKTRIQEDFFDKIGLIVDVPKQGSGTSNTGNTARKFFRDPDLTSKITGVDRELIFRFSIILQAIASGKEIDTLKFDEYCKTTAQLYVTLYNWYYMPVTVHKILLHGAKIIESAVLPVGQLTEEAQEANNKIFKHIRLFNTRKCSREATNTDIGRKLLISTDPLIAHYRRKWQKKKNILNLEAQGLIKVCKERERDRELQH